MQPAGHHLAELNFGELRHDWDDPRVAEFVNGLDMVNALAARSPGFVWRLSDEDMDHEQTSGTGAFGGNPRMASTLSVWQDAASLEHFVWNTVHRQFYDKRALWYDAVGNSNLVTVVGAGRAPAGRGRRSGAFCPIARSRPQRCGLWLGMACGPASGILISTRGTRACVTAALTQNI